MMTENPYLILDVSDTDNDSQIRQAYQQKLKEFPPEKNSREFQLVTEAYKLIRDEVGRARVRVFGRKLEEDTPFAALVPQGEKRRRLPFSDWQQDIKVLNS